MHKELLKQDLYTVTYKDIRNNSKNMHKARSTKLHLHPTDIQEMQYKCKQIRKNNFCLLMTTKNVVIFSRKTNLQFLAPLMCFTFTEHSKQHQSFVPNYLQFMDSAMVTVFHLHFSHWPINIEHSMRMYSHIRYQRLQNCFSNDCLC